MWTVRRWLDLEVGGVDIFTVPTLEETFPLLLEGLELGCVRFELTYRTVEE